MPDLPERADIDQLRRQARELLRAAVAGDPEALTRFRAVAQRPALAAAQLVIAREHGFPSWPALRAAVASRQAPAGPEPADDDSAPAQADVTLGRWSFGGGGTIAVAEGELTVGALVAGPDGAFFEGSLAVPGAVADERPSWKWAAGLTDLAVTVTDDQGMTGRAHFGGGIAGSDGQPCFELQCVLERVPDAASRWLDVRGRDSTSVTRLLRSRQIPARVGELTPLTGSAAERELRDQASFLLLMYLHHDLREGPELKRRCRDLLAMAAAFRDGPQAGGASPLPGQVTRLCTALIRQRPPAGLPAGWHRLLDDADREDGPALHADLDAALPPADGTAVLVNTLVSLPGSWDLYLQATPSWWSYSSDGNHKRAVMTVFAEDDLGGLSLGNFGGSHGRPGYEELKLTFRPRLAPGARLLTLTFEGKAQQVTVQVPLTP